MKDRLEVDEIVETLKSRVTVERLQRIEQVVKGRTDHFVSVLENIYDRGNISAVIRSAEAFGFHNIHLIETVEQKFKAANRVTKGTDKWVHIQKWQSAKEAISHLKGQGFQVLATRLDAQASSIYQVDFSRPTAIVFGNERDGVSEEVIKNADGTVIIPMQGFAQSFNISVAASLVFQFAYLDRVQRIGKNGDLSEEEQKGLIAEYLKRTVYAAEKILDAAADS